LPKYGDPHIVRPWGKSVQDDEKCKMLLINEILSPDYKVMMVIICLCDSINKAVGFGAHVEKPIFISPFQRRLKNLLDSGGSQNVMQKVGGGRYIV
jgi:hypothetical protein